MNLILADVGVGSWILLGVLLLVLIVSPFLMKAKNKKEAELQEKMMDAIKKGDIVLTSAGVIGKVVGIDNDKQGYKTLTIETGDEKHKGYMCVDIRSIYYNLSNPVVNNTSVKKEEKVENKDQSQKEVIEMPEDITKASDGDDTKTSQDETTVEQQSQEKTVKKSSAKKKSKK